MPACAGMTRRAVAANLLGHPGGLMQPVAVRRRPERRRAGAVKIKPGDVSQFFTQRYTVFPPQRARPWLERAHAPAVPSPSVPIHGELGGGRRVPSSSWAVMLVS